MENVEMTPGARLATILEKMGYEISQDKKIFTEGVLVCFNKDMINKTRLLCIVEKAPLYSINHQINSIASIMEKALMDKETAEETIRNKYISTSALAAFVMGSKADNKLESIERRLNNLDVVEDMKDVKAEKLERIRKTVNSINV